MKIVPKAEENASQLPKGVVVERVSYHQPFTVNGRTESTHYKHKGFNMVYTSEGLYGEFQGFKFIVPLSNIIICYYA